MELHVKVLAVLYIAYGAFGLVLSLLMLFVFGDVTGLVDLAAVEEPEALLTVPIIGVIGTFIIGFMLALLVPRVVAGFGLVGRRPWARLLAIVLSVLGLVSFPFGTALGAYGLWVLLSEATGVAMLICARMFFPKKFEKIQCFQSVTNRFGLEQYSFQY